jgi:hypothetical protein
MHANMRLAVCGAMAAAAVAVAGCGSGGTSSGGGTAGATTGASASATTGGGTAVTPSWASGLGPGVTIIGPESASPGTGSPQAVVAGLIAAENSGDYVAACDYYPPALESQCKTQMAAVASASPSALASAMARVTNFGVGYVAIHGDEALVGTTGTFCSSGSCFTNSDPAALLSSGRSFSSLWTASNSSGGDSNSYSLAPISESGGKWYIYSPSSS